MLEDYKYRKPIPLVELYPEAKPHVQHLDELAKQANNAIFELERLYPLGSYERDKLFHARCAVGDAHDKILRDLGIRGR